jgi:methionyl-tRNA formyltransferase
MLMDVGMDTGSMLLKASIPVSLLDDALAVSARLSEASADLLVETLTKLDQESITPQPQEDKLATYARLLEKPDFLMDWSKSAIALHNQVRAFIPNVVAQFHEQPLKVFKTVPFEIEHQDLLPPDLQSLATDLSQREMPSFDPGSIVLIAKGHGPVVQTGEGLLLLQSVQPAGKKQQSGWDFANGLRLNVGDHFENGILV